MSEYAKADEPREATGATSASEPRRRAFAMPEGWLGILLLLLVAAVCGGLIGRYWPWADQGVSDERVTALETQVSQLAAGHGGTAAGTVFADLKRSVAQLTDRLDADEARVTALEKAPAQSPAATAAPGQAPVTAAPDASGLRARLDASTAALAQLAVRVQKLEAANASTAQLTDALQKFVALQARVSVLDADIARFSETQKGTMDAVNARLAAIEAALPPHLGDMLATLATKTDVAAANDRLQRLEAANDGDTLHRAAGILALADLAQTANDGKPFKVELDALAAAQPNDPAVRALAPYSTAGVPTLASLRARFPDVARAALDILRVTQANDTASRLWVNIASLISIRRVGDVAGSDPDARLARAQVHLNANDLAGAANEVAAIGKPSEAALAPWLKDARARVTVDAAIAALDARVLRALSATRTATP